jgi:sugar phosphate permease
MEMILQLANKLANSLNLLTGGVTNITDNIRDFISPIYLLVVSVVAIIFLLRRQTSALIQFMVIAIIVGVLLFTPDVITTVANLISQLFNQ